MTRSGFSCHQRAVVEPEAPHGPGGEVLGHGVGPADQPLGQGHPFGVLQVEGQPELAHVQGVEHVRPLEPAGIPAEPVGAQEVGPRPRLDPDHGGPVLGEVADGDGPGRPRPELEDLGPGPGARSRSRWRPDRPPAGRRPPAGGRGRRGRDARRRHRGSSPPGRNGAGGSSRRRHRRSPGRPAAGSRSAAGASWPGPASGWSPPPSRRARSWCGGGSTRRWGRRWPRAPRRSSCGGRRWSSPARSAPGWPVRPRRPARVMVCRFFTRALPPRRPKETKPSAQGQISRVTPMLAPDRFPRIPFFGKRPAWPMEAIITASWAETSTTWGRPEASPVRAAMAASGPTWDQPVGSRAAHRGPVGVAGAVHVPGRGHHPEVARLPARPGPVTTEGGDVDPDRVRGRVDGSTSRPPGQPGVARTTSASASSAASRGSDALQLDHGLPGVPDHGPQRASRRDRRGGPAATGRRRAVPPG